MELVFVSRPPAGACSSQQGPAQQAKSGLLPPRAAQTSLAEEAKKTGKILKGPFFFAQINGFVKNALKTCNSPMKNGWKILMRHFFEKSLRKMHTFLTKKGTSHINQCLCENGLIFIQQSYQMLVNFHLYGFFGKSLCKIT